MKFKKYDLSQKSAQYFFVIFLLMSVFCSYAIANQELPKNRDEAMTELERIKRGEAPKGGMSQQNFMRMIEESYTEEDKKILCENNLKKIRAAKESYINDNLDQLDKIKEITKEQLEQYIKGGFSSLICKSGGKYTIGGKDTMPACSVHGPLR
jgi:hypothetical protein